MRIPIDHDSPTPLYRQVQQYLQEQIRCGGLAAETRLPSSREMAAGLGVSRLTVTEAYDELEALGYIYTVRGRGTFVSEASISVATRSAELSVDPIPYWQAELQSPGWTSASLRLDGLIDSASGPDVISFAQGGGDSDLFPLSDFRQALQAALRHAGRDALGYGDAAGYLPLRATIAQILAGQGIPTRQEQVLVTSGGQQGLDLAFRLLLHPGDTVISESPTHMGFSDLCRSLNVRQVEVPVDEQGMDVDRLEALLAEIHPRLIYTIPNFQNPTGACLSSVRRRKLVALAERHQVPILEDDFVGDLRYRGLAQPALKALDRSGTVIYVGTFSKMLIPGLRIGYIVAGGAAGDRTVFDRLLDLKHTSDVASSNLVQRALDEYITVGRYQACLRRARRIFGRRRDAMLQALARYMPAGTRWTAPQGGMFVWLSLPDGRTADDIFPLAAKAGVLFAPGSLFYPDLRPSRCLRLNFARQSLAAIDEGIRRLGAAIR
jgi:GntR family transcriptional regulator / MocR family aminotransferase